MWSLPESLLQPLLQRLHLEKAQKLNGEQITAKQFLFNSDPALRNVVAKEALQLRRGNVTQVASLAASTTKKSPKKYNYFRSLFIPL